MDNKEDEFSNMSVTIPSVAERYYDNRRKRIISEANDLEEFFSILLTDSEITEYDMAVKYGLSYDARLEVAKHLSIVISTLKEANGFFVHDKDKFTAKEVRTYRKILKSVGKMYKRLYKKLKELN